MNIKLITVLIFTISATTVFCQEIKYADDIDADMEAQDFDKFGKNKI